MERTHSYCFAIEPIVLFKNKSRLPFLNTKGHSKVTTLQKKYIVLIMNKYKLSSAIFYLNNKIIENSNMQKKCNANVKNVIAKRSSMLNQSEYSNRALRDDKAQHVHLGRNR